MYIKRISALMLALVMLLTLAGCSDKAAEDTVLAEYHGFEITQSTVDTQKQYIQKFNDSIEVENTLSLAPKDDSTGTIVWNILTGRMLLEESESLGFAATQAEIDDAIEKSKESYNKFDEIKREVDKYIKAQGWTLDEYWSSLSDTNYETISRTKLQESMCRDFCELTGYDGDWTDKLNTNSFEIYYALHREELFQQNLADVKFNYAFDTITVKTHSAAAIKVDFGISTSQFDRDAIEPQLIYTRSDDNIAEYVIRFKEDCSALFAGFDTLPLSDDAADFLADLGDYVYVPNVSEGKYKFISQNGGHNAAILVYDPAENTAWYVSLGTAPFSVTLDGGEALAEYDALSHEYSRAVLAGDEEKAEQIDAQMKALEKAAGIESTQNEPNYPVVIGGVALCCIFAALSITGYVRAKKRQKQLEKELEKFRED